MTARLLAAAAALMIALPMIEARAVDDCSYNANPDAMIAACTQLMGRAALSDSARAAALVMRASAYNIKGDQEHAFADLTAAIRLDPHNDEAFWARHLIYQHERKDLDHALADIDAAVKLKPDNYAYLDARASIYAKKGDLERARADYDAAVRLNPSALELEERGNIFRKLGNYERALADYEDAYRKDATYANAIGDRNIAHAALALGPALDGAAAAAESSSERQGWRVKPETVGLITVEDWRRGGSFHHCAVLEGDKRLAHALGRGAHGYALTVASSAWSLPPNASYPVRLALPDTPAKESTARAVDAITIAIPLGDDGAFMGAMKRVTSFNIEAAQGTITVPLFATDSAIDALDACWRNAAGVQGANPFGAPGQNPFAGTQQGSRKPTFPRLPDVLGPASPR